MSSLHEKIKSVAEFHTVFKIGNADQIKLIDENDYLLRFNLIKEENEEYLEACKNNDIIEIADALGDQLYILFGTILKHGLEHKIEEVYDEIHSNLFQVIKLLQSILALEKRIKRFDSMDLSLCNKT